jgi:hypothetical protein
MRFEIECIVVIRGDNVQLLDDVCPIRITTDQPRYDQYSEPSVAFLNHKISFKLSSFYLNELPSRVSFKSPVNRLGVKRVSKVEVAM